MYVGQTQQEQTIKPNSYLARKRTKETKGDLSCTEGRAQVSREKVREGETETFWLLKTRPQELRRVQLLEKPRTRTSRLDTQEKTDSRLGRDTNHYHTWDS